jgi:glycerol-3-phosphate acyltransferase PlsY
MAPWSLLVLAPVVVIVIWRSRYVSLGSVSGALLAPLVVAILFLAELASGAAIVYALASGVLVTAAHADNIARLRAGTERKLGQRAKATDA